MWCFLPDKNTSFNLVYCVLGCQTNSCHSGTMVAWPFRNVHEISTITGQTSRRGGHQCPRAGTKVALPLKSFINLCCSQGYCARIKFLYCLVRRLGKDLITNTPSMICATSEKVLPFVDVSTNLSESWVGKSENISRRAYSTQGSHVEQLHSIGYLANRYRLLRCLTSRDNNLQTLHRPLLRLLHGFGR